MKIQVREEEAVVEVEGVSKKQGRTARRNDATAVRTSSVKYNPINQQEKTRRKGRLSLPYL